MSASSLTLGIIIFAQKEQLAKRVTLHYSERSPPKNTISDLVNVP